MAPKRRTICATLIVRLIMSELLCVVGSAEVPELLTLSDLASNDFTICRTSESSHTAGPREAYSRHQSYLFACLMQPDLLTLKDEPRY